MLGLNYIGMGIRMKDLFVPFASECLPLQSK